MEDDDELDIRERIFHNTVRENIIFLLLFIILYLISWMLIGYFKKSDQDDCLYCDDDEVAVYKISLYLCTFTLSVSLCATLLLPLSIVSNEVLLLYPKSYYVKWLNHSLVQGIWNLVFLFSNISLFALLPFAYLFTESEGLRGYQKGIKSRIYETVMVLSLMAAVIFGLTYVLSALFDSTTLNFKTLHDFGCYCLPFLYSCISFIGVMMLLLCTPVGLTQLFGLVSASMAKPHFIYDIHDDISTASLEELTLIRRLGQAEKTQESYITPKPMSPPPKVSPSQEDGMLGLLNGALQVGLKHRLVQVNQRKQSLLRQEATSKICKNIGYPVALCGLIGLTVLSVLLVVLNSLQLLVGLKALPATQEFKVGLQSLSLVGWVGGVFEVVEVVYLAVTSYLGLYTLPFISAALRPKPRSTTLTLLLANSALLLVLSSALPLLARILGITNFDLLGDFGKIEWLGNLNIVLLYNFTFALVTTLCLVNKLTPPMLKELMSWVRTVMYYFDYARNIFSKVKILSTVAPHYKTD